MGKIKNYGFIKYILIVFSVTCLFLFSACDPGDDFEVHFVIVSGVSGQISVDSGVLQSSEDGTVWDSTNSYYVNDSSLTNITYYYDRFVAVGSDKGVYFSEDGMTWTRGNIYGCGVFCGIAGGESNTWSQPWVAHYVAVGTDGMVYFSTNDGVDWTLASDTQTTTNLMKVAFGTVVIQGNSVSRFVAVGEVDPQPPDINPPVNVYNIIWSQDGGDNWYGASSGRPSYNLEAVAYGNSRFVAVGAYATIVYSDNGAGWTAAPPATDVGEYLMGVAYGNGMWVITGGQGLVWYSLNGGITWQEGTAPVIAGGFGINDVVFGGNKFVAIGFTASGEGLVMDSINGINWSLVTTFPASPDKILGIAFKPY
jgi:hypothetical protein